MIYRTKVLANHLWARACEHDGIDPKQGRAVFTSSNPHGEKARRATALLARAWRGHQRKLPR